MNNYEVFLIADNIINIIAFAVCIAIGFPLVMELISLHKKSKK